jgi:hypothetical protein
MTARANATSTRVKALGQRGKKHRGFDGMIVDGMILN